MQVRDALSSVKIRNEASKSSRVDFVGMVRHQNRAARLPSLNRRWDCWLAAPGGGRIPTMTLVKKRIKVGLGSWYSQRIELFNRSIE